MSTIMPAAEVRIKQKQQQQPVPERKKKFKIWSLISNSLLVWNH